MKKMRFISYLLLLVLIVSSFFIGNTNSVSAEVKSNIKYVKSKIEPNKVYDIVDFPFKESKAKKYAELLVETFQEENAEKIVALEVETALFENSKFKQTIKADQDTEYFYYGKIKNGCPSGDGVVIYFANDLQCILLHSGNFKEGRLDGYGIEVMIFGDVYELPATIVYEGNYKKGLRSGTGVEYYEGNSELVGSAKGFIGEKILVAAQGIRYDGKFKNGEYDGKGTLYESCGDGVYKLYEGEFDFGKYKGKGSLFFPNGKIKYKGEFKNGQYDGKGTLYNEDGSKYYSGQFKKGDVK